MANKNYFRIVHKGFQKDLQREEIQIHAGENCNIFIIKTDEGFIVDVYDQNDVIETMTVWEDDVTPEEPEDDELNVQEETGAPENFSDVEIAEFKENWKQSHKEVCSNLNYDPKTSDDLIMLDYFWYAPIKGSGFWIPKCSSLYTPREQAIADFLKYKN